MTTTRAMTAWARADIGITSLKKFSENYSEPSTREPFGTSTIIKLMQQREIEHYCSKWLATSSPRSLRMVCRGQFALVERHIVRVKSETCKCTNSSLLLGESLLML